MIRRIPEQLEIAQQIADAFANGAEDVFLEAPTGSGKSGIAYFAHDLSGYDTGICSHQKVLQDQYQELLKDQNGFITLKGKVNYKCRRMTNLRVDQAPCQFDKKRRCPLKSKCEYFRLRDLAPNMPVVNTNYQLIFSLLDVGQFEFPKDLFIFDECHNLPSIFTDYRKVRFGSIDVKNYNKIVEICDDHNLGALKEYTEDAIGFHNTLDIENIDEDNVIPILEKVFYYKSEIARLIDSILDRRSDEMELLRTLGTFHSFETKSHCKWGNLQENWAHIIDKENFVVEKQIDSYNNKYSLELVPLKIDSMFPQTVEQIAPKRLYMSSTIFGVERFRSELGLKGKYEKIILDSKFPVENRKIYYIPLKQLNNTLLYEKVHELDDYFDTMYDIVENHADQDHSGVIFSPSYKMTNLILEKLGSKFNKLGVEVLYNTNSSERDRIIEEFRNRSFDEKKLLISPSFYEGINFENDISRYQIIAKVPFLSLGSKYVKAMLHQDNVWYSLQAIKQIVQGAGRSVRNKDDFAITYILDSNWGRIYNQCQYNIPFWFKNAIENVG